MPTNFIDNFINGIFNNVVKTVQQKVAPPTIYEQKIRALIKENNNLGLLSFIQILLILVPFALFKFFFLFRGPMLFLFVVAIIVVAASFIITTVFKQKIHKTKTLLLRAVDNIRKNYYDTALTNLINAYKIKKDQRILDIIIEFSKEFKPSEQNEIEILEITTSNQKKSKEKDKKLTDILNQIQIVTNYIIKHQNLIKTSLEKITDLQKQSKEVKDTVILNEYSSLIKRYNDIIELENSKISFYSKAKGELLKLKENHIITQKLLTEKRELETLEDSLLEKSIIESNEKEMSIEDFVSYENAYLEAIKEYSEQISTSRNQNLFEEVIQTFKDKTNML